MRIGDTVVRVKNTFNLSTVGDIRVINNMKVYNKGLCLNLVGDKPDTWHSSNDFRPIEDVDMPCLAEKLSHVRKSLNAFNGHMKKVNKERAARAQVTKKRNKFKQMASGGEIFYDMSKESFDFSDEPEDDEPFEVTPGVFIDNKDLLL